MDAFEIPAPVQALVKALGDSSARVATVDVGNPHLIVGVDAAMVDVASFDIASFGVRVEEHFMDAFGGINVHVVSRLERRPNESGLKTGAVESPVRLAGRDRTHWWGSKRSGVGARQHKESSVDVLAMTIWERGVGITEACGTGATAVAVAAHGWGWVGPICELRQPGGSARVEIVGEQLTLIGPSQFVATSDFAWNQ
jgi:diaminopimelate epimerase